MAFYPYTLKVVRSEPELALTRRLLQAYAASLEIDRIHPVRAAANAAFSA